MVRSRYLRVGALGVWALALLMVTLYTARAAAQNSTTAMIRGNVQDSTGSVLPGATITLTNQGTKAVTTAVTDDRGQYLLAGLPRRLRPEGGAVRIQDLRTEERHAVAERRARHRRQARGRQADARRSRSPRRPKSSRPRPGAREGVLSAKQIDNLSVIGRSSLELLRILPGVVTDFNVGESVSFGGGANNTQGYTVNGIRSSGNTVQLDGSSLIDIGSNSGVIVTLNNDMVQEVKVQSSNFAAEYGAGGMNVSGVTKAGSSKFHGEGYDYWRDYRFAANDRSNSITNTPKPKSSYQYPGGNFGGPLFFGDNYTKNHDKLFFFVGLEAQRQQVDSGARFSRTFTDAAKRNGDFSELLANRGSNLNSVPQLMIPQGFPGAGTPAPNNNMAPYMTPLGKYIASLYPLTELQRSEQSL